MQEPILVINAGSSSIKFSILETDADRTVSVWAHGQVGAIGSAPYLEVSDAIGSRLAKHRLDKDGFEPAIAAIHHWFGNHIGREAEFSGVGHRVVHGGELYFDPVVIDAHVLADLRSLVSLAPLHQPHNIAAIEVAAAFAPGVPQIACFDTAFHRNQPRVAQQFALPRALTTKGIRRYGFHGLSYQYIVSVLPKIVPECIERKLVICHLGNGASMCAIEHGRSVATTMGFSALDGLPMGTRSGALDPGVVLYLLQHEGMTADAVEHLLYEQSGLLGVSGISQDMRTLLDSGEASAREAVNLFVYRISRELGSLAAALGGLDALIFTGGIGEHAAEVRARVCEAAQWLGIVLDPEANQGGRPRISHQTSNVSVWMIPTDENLMIARQTRRLLDYQSNADGSKTPIRE